MVRSEETGTSGSVLDATDTPRRDVFKYVGAYPLLVVAGWWVTRTGEVGPVEPSYGVHHTLTENAEERLRIVLFALGIVLWSILGVGTVLWLSANVGFLPMHR